MNKRKKRRVKFETIAVQKAQARDRKGQAKKGNMDMR